MRNKREVLERLLGGYWSIYQQLQDKKRQLDKIKEIDRRHKLGLLSSIRRLRTVLEQLAPQSANSEGSDEKVQEGRAELDSIQDAIINTYPRKPEEVVTPGQVGRRLIEIVGSDYLIVDKARMKSYVRGFREPSHTEPKGKALFVVRPKTTEELSAILAYLYGKGFSADKAIEYVIQGGNTGLVGASTPNESGKQIIIDMGLLKSIRLLDLSERVCAVGAGVTIEEFDQFLSDNNINGCCAISVGQRGITTIAGMVATNANGINSPESGVMRMQVRGGKHNLPNGAISEDHNTLRKDNSSPPLAKLWSGLQGTTGPLPEVIITYKLRNAYEQSFMFQVSEQELSGTITHLKSKFAAQLASMEIISAETLRIIKSRAPALFETLFEGRPANSQLPVILTKFKTDCENDEASVKTKVDQALSYLKGKRDDSKDADKYWQKILTDEQQDQAWLIRRGIATTTKSTLTADHMLVPLDVSIALSEVQTFISRLETKMREIEALVGCQIKVSFFGHISDGGLHNNIICKFPEGMTNKEKQQIKELITMEGSSIVHDLGGNVGSEHGYGPSNIMHILSNLRPGFIYECTKLVESQDPYRQSSPGSKIDDVALEQAISSVMSKMQVIQKELGHNNKAASISEATNAGCSAGSDSNPSTRTVSPSICAAQRDPSWTVRVQRDGRIFAGL